MLKGPILNLGGVSLSLQSKSNLTITEDTINSPFKIQYNQDSTKHKHDTGQLLLAHCLQTIKNVFLQHF